MDRERNNGPYWFGDKQPKMEYTVSTIARIRTALVHQVGKMKERKDPWAWEFEQMIRGIDSLKEYETPEEARHRAYCTPSTLLTDEERATLLTPEQLARHNAFVERREREAACPGHEMVSTSTRDESQRGNHKGHCKHCGKDMSYDSGD